MQNPCVHIWAVFCAPKIAISLYCFRKFTPREPHDNGVQKIQFVIFFISKSFTFYEDLYEISCWFKIDRKQYARQSKVTENKYFIGIDWAEACNDVEEKFSENMKRNNQFDA